MKNMEGDFSMSYLVARMQKMKSQNLGGIQKHNQREFENHSNEDIDKDRSYLNYDLVNSININYKENIMSIIDEQNTSDRKIRKDAVLVNEWIITSDHEYFKEMDPEEIKRFFETATEFFGNRYGKQNLAYAQVHMDETTPHMHLGVVPMREGKLQSRNIFTRKELLAVQDEFPRHMQDNGFKLERGEPNAERKHLTVEEYKEMHSRLVEMTQIEEQKKNRIKYLSKEENALKERLNNSKSYLREVHPKPKVREFRLKTGETIYGLTEVEFERLDAIRRTSNEVISENQRLEKRNKELEEEKINKDTQVEDLRKMLQMARKRLNAILDGGNDLWDRCLTYASKFHKKGQEIVSRDMLENINGENDFKDWQQKNKEVQQRKNLQR